VSRRALRSVLVACIVFGLASWGAGAGSLAVFADEEVGSGSIVAAGDFGSSAAERLAATGAGEYEGETVKFELSNGGDEGVTVASFAVDTTVDGDATMDYVKVALSGATGPGTTLAEDESTPFVADGSTYAVSAGPSAATIDPGTARFLKVEWVGSVAESGLAVVDQANADIAVTLAFADGSAATYYLAPTDEEDGGLGHGED